MLINEKVNKIYIPDQREVNRVLLIDNIRVEIHFENTTHERFIFEKEQTATDYFDFLTSIKKENIGRIITFEE